MNIDIIDIDTVDATTVRIDGLEFAKADCAVSAYGSLHAQIVVDGITFIVSHGSAVDGRRPIGQTALLTAIETLLTPPGTASSLVVGGMQFQDPALTGHALMKPTASNTAGRFHLEPKGYPEGTQSKIDIMLDPYDEDSSNYRIGNFYAKGYTASDTSTTQGNNGVVVLGAKGMGNHWGVFPTMHVGFQDDGGESATPLKLYYFDTSDTTWRTPNKGGWRAGMSVTSGDYVTASNKLYQSQTTGTTGATAPSHASSTASDGAITWLFVRDFSAASGSFRGVVMVGHRDDMPKFSLTDVRLQVARDAALWNNVKLNFLGSTHAADWAIYSPSATDDLRIECNDGTARYLRFDKSGKFFQPVALAELLGAPVTITSGDATPSIAGAQQIAAAGSTAITSFSGGLPYQVFYFIGNGTVQLTHSASLSLVGAANLTPASGRILQFRMNGAGTAATQVG